VISEKKGAGRTPFGKREEGWGGIKTHSRVLDSRSEEKEKSEEEK